MSVVALVELLVLARVHYWATGRPGPTREAQRAGRERQKLGQTIFTAYLLPFEMTSALLVIAVVAAVVLVGDRRPGLARPGSPASREAAQGPTADRPAPTTVATGQASSPGPADRAGRR